MYVYRERERARERERNNKRQRDMRERGREGESDRETERERQSVCVFRVLKVDSRFDRLHICSSMRLHTRSYSFFLCELWPSKLTLQVCPWASQ